MSVLQPEGSVLLNNVLFALERALLRLIALTLALTLTLTPSPHDTC